MHFPILAADDQQRRRADAAQRMRAGEIGAAAARDDGIDSGSGLGGRDQRGGGARARAEVAERQHVLLRVIAQPARRAQRRWLSRPMSKRVA